MNDLLLLVPIQAHGNAGPSITCSKFTVGEVASAGRPKPSLNVTASLLQAHIPRRPGPKLVRFSNMPIRIRMSMHGRCNRRIFHINVVEGTRKRDAKPTELLGIYDPHVPVGENTKKIEWSVDRIRYWLSVGAKPSTSVVKLLELGGILKPGSPYRPQPKQSKSSPTLEAVAEAQAARAAASS